MRPYFEQVPPFGREVNEGQIKSTEQNVGQIDEYYQALSWTENGLPKAEVFKRLGLG